MDLTINTYRDIRNQKHDIKSSLFLFRNLIPLIRRQKSLTMAPDEL